ncbi:hypothetical protein GGD38_004930 [Chitinophagaceae bacterium OAS944]|nr:hypothetical protein [Chitinophagaceae bacterium OAS944]
MAADMKYIYNLTPFLFICFCVCFCNGPGPIEKPVSIVEDSIVLKVGDMQITWYELNKNFDHYKMPARESISMASNSILVTAE